MATELTAGSGIADAERSVARMYAVLRAGQLFFSSLMVAGDRRRYARPRLQVALLGAAAVESAWVTRRVLRKGTYRDRAVMWVDTSFAALGLGVCQAGLGAGDGALWMKNFAIGAAHSSSSADDGVERIAAMGLLGSAAILCGVRAQGRDEHVAGVTLAVNDVINWTGQHAAARIYVTAHRRYALLSEAAATLAVERAKETAAEAERTRQHETLHARTIAVLHDLASVDDAGAATRIARREASRLRYALRTYGRTRRDVDAALESACGSAEAEGLSVELVASELSGDVNTDVGAVLQEALSLALFTAVDHGQAGRAVVRASDDDATLVVTVRYQGTGFDPGTGSRLERQLHGIAPLLAGVGGTAELWSAPGRGVRVTLRVPRRVRSIDGRIGDQSTDALPELGVGRDAAGDDNVAHRERDGAGRGGRPVVDTAQHEVGAVRIVDDGESGRSGETLESRPQERSRRDDRGGRRLSHPSTMPDALTPVVVRSTPFAEVERSSAEEAARAERTIVAALSAYRFSGLATGLAAVLGGRGHYRRRGVALAGVALAGLESVWMTRRLWRAGGHDEPACVGDTAAALVAVAAVRMNLGSADRGTFLNWAPWGFAAPAVTGQAMLPNRLSGRDTARAVAIGAAASASLGHRRGQFIPNMGAMTLLFAGGRMLAQQIRRSSLRLQTAQARAIDEGVVLAAEHERSRQLRVLHDSALQTLEAAGSGRYRDLAAIRKNAREGADRLESEMGGTSQISVDIADAVRRVVQAHNARGLEVDLEVEELVAVPDVVAAALGDACNEALTNVAKHARASSANVRVTKVDHGVEIVIADDGVGFDPATTVGFGTSESIRRRLDDVGGRADIVSQPGQGTRVRLWGPA